MPLPEEQRAKLDAIVQRMTADGQSPDAIRMVVSDFKTKYEAPATPERGWGDTFADALPTIGGMVGGMAAKAPVIGSIAAGIGGAAGEGYRQLAKHAGELPGAMRDVASNLISQPGATMRGAMQGAAEGAMQAGQSGVTQAAAEGGGRIISKGLQAIAKPIYNFGLGASKALRREYPDLAETGLREGIAVSGRGTEKAGRLLTAASKKTDDALAARDAYRPPVRGYLPEATEAIPLGPVPKPSGGRPGAGGSEPGGSWFTTKLDRAQKYGKKIVAIDFPQSELDDMRIGQPMEDRFSLGTWREKARPLGEMASQPPEGAVRLYRGEASEAVGDVVAGPGTIRRPMNAAHGPGAPPTMIDPREIAKALAGPRAELSQRALGVADVDQLGQLQTQFLANQSRPLTLTQANAMKRAEQKIADASYRSAEAGHPINAVESQFHKAIASGAREAIERKAPEVAALNKKTQAIGGLKSALDDASTRNHILSRLIVPTAAGVSAGFGSGDVGTGIGSALTTAALTSPGNLSRGAIGAYKFGQANIPAHLIRAAIIAQLEQD